MFPKKVYKINSLGVAFVYTLVEVVPRNRSYAIYRDYSFMPIRVHRSELGKVYFKTEYDCLVKQLEFLDDVSKHVRLRLKELK
jgi:hypothetical protein